MVFNVFFTVGLIISWKIANFQKMLAVMILFNNMISSSLLKRYKKYKLMFFYSIQLVIRYCSIIYLIQSVLKNTNGIHMKFVHKKTKRTLFDWIPNFVYFSIGWNSKQFLTIINFTESYISNSCWCFNLNELLKGTKNNSKSLFQTIFCRINNMYYFICFETIIQEMTQNFFKLTWLRKIKSYNFNKQNVFLLLCWSIAKIMINEMHA